MNTVYINIQGDSQRIQIRRRRKQFKKVCLQNQNKGFSSVFLFMSWYCLNFKKSLVLKVQTYYYSKSRFRSVLTVFVSLRTLEHMDHFLLVVVIKCWHSVCKMKKVDCKVSVNPDFGNFLLPIFSKWDCLIYLATHSILRSKTKHIRKIKWGRVLLVFYFILISDPFCINLSNNLIIFKKCVFKTVVMQHLLFKSFAK